VNLPEIVRFTRTHWAILLIASVIGIVAGMGMSLAKPHTYKATAQILVTTGNEPSAEAARWAIEFAQAQIPSYALLVKSQENATRAVDAIGSSENPARLAGRISTSFVKDSVVLNVSVTDRDPEHAVILVNAVADEFTKLAQEVDTPQAVAQAANTPPEPVQDTAVPSAPTQELGSGLGAGFQNLGPWGTAPRATRATVVRPAAAPAQAVSRGVTRNAALGVVLGLLVGVGVGLAVQRVAKPATDGA